MIQSFDDLEILSSLQQGDFLLEREAQFFFDLDGKRRIDCQELLIRWQHPLMGLLYPTAFLASSDAAHVMREIDYWVLAQAIERLMVYPREFLAINLADSTIRDFQFKNQIETLIPNNFPCEALEIEIHELSTVSDMKISNINFLHNLGIKIVLDDYGTGNGEIQKIVELPVSKIKIDRSLTLRRNQGKYRAVIRHLINLCRELEITVCAEGIETIEELEEMRALGCQLFQGYFFK